MFSTYAQMPSKGYYLTVENHEEFLGVMVHGAKKEKNEGSSRGKQERKDDLCSDG